MAEAKKTNKKDFSKKTIAELRSELLLAQKGLYDGTLANPHHLRDIKKAIARKMTNERMQKGDK